MPRGDTDKQYLLGQYMTPPKVADLFFKHVRLPPADWRVLDPACGDGNLVLAAAQRMLEAGLEPREIAARICGVDIDPEMVEACRARLAALLGLDERHLLVHVGDYMAPQQELFSHGHAHWRDFRANLVLSNPPYGQNREYDFFRVVAERHPAGTVLAFLVPLAFMDRLIGGTVEPLDGRPLGVTTGHCLVWHTVGEPWRYRAVKSGRRNSSPFTVYSGIKLYERGAGIPPQSDDIVRAKPYSSDSPRLGWLPCVRTGDVSPFKVGLDRLWVSWGPHLAHPKELARFQGPRLFVRRVPIWANRQLGAAYLEQEALCAGDVLVIRHHADDGQLLKGLCVWLNSAEAAMHVLARRPSVKHRTSFPKISGKDLNMLFEHDLPGESTLLALAAQYPTDEGGDEVTAPEETDDPTLGNLRVEEISRASVREKSIRHGHISTLQFWWARRPLAACRSVIFAALRPRDALAIPPELLGRLRKLFPDEPDDNSRLDALAGALAAWEAIGTSKLLELSRSILQVGRDTTPVVLDPFAGGGSIPVEAQRLGLAAIAGELHPVAAAALRLAVEKLPASTDVVRHYLLAADAVSERLTRTCSELYPGPETILAYLWCRTYRCPSCSTESPLLRNRYLAQRPRKAVVLLSTTEQGIEYEVVNDATEGQLKAAASGTVSDRGAKCARCGDTVNADFLRNEGKNGRLGEVLYAVHELLPDGTRRYRGPSKNDLEVLHALPVPNAVPSVDLDWNGVRHLWSLQYGITSTQDLHSRRQQHALTRLVATVREVLESPVVEPDVAEAVALLLAVTVNRTVMYGNRHVWWQSNGEFPANIFVRQAISMVWSFVEMPVTSPGAAGWQSAVEWVRKAAEHLERLPVKGRLAFGDAAALDVDDGTVDLVFSDPPYYDAITYGYLADVFVPWMRAVLDGHVDGALAGLPVHRSEEAIVDRPHAQAPSPKGDEHFRAKMAAAFTEMRRVVKPGGAVVLMYGHKKPSAWAAFLEPLLESGLMPVETWPIHTERKAKFKHNKIGALATSCVLVCRPWEATERAGDRTLAEFRDQLYSAVVSQIDRFEGFGLDGADLSAALLAPIVAEWCRHRVTDGTGKLVPLARLFENIGEWSRTFERRYLAERLRDTFGDEWVDAHLNSEEAPREGESLPAVRYALALSEGDASLADQIAIATDRMELGAGLRLLALAPSSTAHLEKGALAGIGRLAMQGRGQLPGSARA